MSTVRVAGQAQEEVVGVAGDLPVIRFRFGDRMLVTGAETAEFLRRARVMTFHTIPSGVRTGQREAVEEVHIAPTADRVTRFAIVRELKRLVVRSSVVFVLMAGEAVRGDRSIGPCRVTADALHAVVATG